MNSAWIGIDIGTQGARVVAIDGRGLEVVSAREPFADFASPEQSADSWWESTARLLTAVAAECQDLRMVPRAIAVSGTSGTIIGLDTGGDPVTPALMYHDSRSHKQASVISAASGLPLNASWALPKIAWYRESFPNQARKVAMWRHPTDIITGRLTGDWYLTDETSALKTGYDPAAGSWHYAALAATGIDTDVLSTVVRSGTPVGPVTALIPGLADAMVTTGVTDGCASHIASGAVWPGMWNTTIGTTMVIKGTLIAPIKDPLARIYNPRHPDGYWFPGAASNTGAGWITAQYAEDDINQLTDEARRLVPLDRYVYPLHTTGERFPFIASGASGFADPSLSHVERFAAGLEGVAYLERMSYALFEHQAGQPIVSITTTGGGSRSDVWMQIRSNVLGKAVHRAKHADASVGAAIVGASHVGYGSLLEAASHLTQQERLFESDPVLSAVYAERYREFVAVLAGRGYLDDPGEYL